jgi:hypothetical protein
LAPRNTVGSWSVDEAHGNQDQTGAEVGLRPPEVVEVGELQADLMAGVLVLDLRVEQPVVVELVAEVEDRPQQVERIAAAGRGAIVPLVLHILVDQLAVAADRQPPLRAVDLGRRRPEAVGAGVGLGGRLADPELLDLLGEHLELALQLGEPVIS